ncbi:MAG: hypothetical protein WDW38_001484 [Sanguina aurantia]
MSDSEPISKKARTEYAHSRESFLTTYKVLTDELVQDGLLGEQPKHAQDYFKEILDYNVPGGKLNRGMAVYDVLVAILGSENLTEDNIFKANSLGWCIEWLQAFFLVADDIMDGSITRRGQPCWYKQPKVGLLPAADRALPRGDIPDQPWSAPRPHHRPPLAQLTSPGTPWTTTCAS